jgi:TetR/AcrR family transcriptional regulator, transcriptional repressor for nem operon
MRKGEQTLQEIIRNAAPIFNQRGYDGATLSDLMDATASKKAESTGILKAKRS